MNTMIKTLSLVSLLVCGMNAHADEAYKTIDLNYDTSKIVALPAAQNQTVAVQINDMRTGDKSNLGRLKNYFGISGPYIKLSKGVKGASADELQDDLKAEGFEISNASDKKVIVNVIDFNVKKNVWKQGMVADLKFNVQILNHGKLIYTKDIEENGYGFAFGMAGVDSSKRSINEAMNKSMNTILTDKSFIDALLAAPVESSPKLAVNTLQSVP